MAGPGGVGWMTARPLADVHGPILQILRFNCVPAATPIMTFGAFKAIIVGELDPQSSGYLSLLGDLPAHIHLDLAMFWSCSALPRENSD